MANLRGSILLIAEDGASRRAVQSFLEREGLTIEAAENLASARVKLSAADYSAIVADFTLKGGSSRALLAEETPPLIFLADHPTYAQSVALMREGAWDYLPKPIDLAALRESLKQLLSRRGKGAPASQTAKTPRAGKSNFIAESPAMKAVERTIAQVAGSRATVMVFGESGVGKEVVARAIHQASDRSGATFSPISCAAIPESLIESELFGYEKGAFTGAIGGKPGRFEAASGGTLFLDEVGEVPLSIQAKLLRVLQEREIERLGSLSRTPIDVRVVTATHRDLRHKVKEGTFRLDLLFRLQVVEITVPPLRERPEDLRPLAQLFLAKYAKENGRSPLNLSSVAERELFEHTWPGNVRELENAMERATVLAPREADQTGPLFLSKNLALAA